MWMNEFGIDGLRLDAADCLSKNFIQELHTFCKQIDPDFWLMGEVIHGDYRQWANPSMLDSVTNYECYKALYSSLADKNYFEIAYALNRQFGAEGIYRGLPLYNFADNHDVDRVASKLTNPAHLYTLHLLLFTMPGIPSVYYGSEWGIEGFRTLTSDAVLRPALNLAEMERTAPHPGLPDVITRLASLRASSSALQHGSYKQVLVDHQQLAFLRQSAEETILVILNSAEFAVSVSLKVPTSVGTAVDILNDGETYRIINGKLEIPNLPACWGRVLRLN